MNGLLKKISIYTTIIILFFPSCSFSNKGFLDTLELGKMTTAELSDMVKNKAHIEIYTYTNTNSFDIVHRELKDDEIVNEECRCKTVEFISVNDPIIANYKGITGEYVNFTAYDGNITEYEIDLPGAENIAAVLDAVYSEHPDIKLMDDGTIRLKKYIDENTVIQIWVNDFIEENLFVTVTYTTNAEASRFWLYPNWDDEIIENAERVRFEKNENGKYEAKIQYKEI